VELIGRESANAVIKTRTGTWGLGLDHLNDASNCYLQMLAAGERRSREFKIQKGMEEKSDLSK